MRGPKEAMKIHYAYSAIEEKLNELLKTVDFGLLTFAGVRNYGCSPFLVPLASDGEGGVEGVVLSLESLPKGFALMAAIQIYQ